MAQPRRRALALNEGAAMEVRVTGGYIGEDEQPDDFEVVVTVGGEAGTDAWHMVLEDATLDALKTNTPAWLQLDETAADLAARCGIRELRYSY